MIRRVRWLAPALAAAALLVASCSDDSADTADPADQTTATGGPTAAAPTTAAGSEPTTTAATPATTVAPPTTAPADSSWSMLGRDLANSRAADETTIGPDNVAGLEPAWEVDGIKGLTGTPVVADGVVYFGDWTGHVRALDVETGQELWATDIETNYVGGAVAIDDERVYAGSFEAELVALDRETGELLWETDVDTHPMAVIFGSPLAVDGRVIVGVASYEVFYPGNPPTFRGQLAALDGATGEVIWRYYTTKGGTKEGVGVPVWASPAVDTERGHVYIGTGQHYRKPTSGRSDALIALDLETGKKIWVRQFTKGDIWTLPEIGKPTAGPDSDIGAPANLFEADGVDAVGAGDKAGVYKAIDRETGEVLWSARLTDGGLQGGVMASAAHADGRIFVSSNKGSAAADLFALDAGTGEILWRTDVGAQMTSPVTWANGVVYLGENSGRIVAYDAATGDELWAHRVLSPASSGIAVVDGTVYAGYGWWLTAPPDDPKGGLIAFRLDTEGDPSESTTPTLVARSGEQVFQQTCASCHGTNGEGASGPSIVDIEDKMSATEQADIVRNGKGEMPSWGDSLTDAEIEAVVDYVRTDL